MAQGCSARPGISHDDVKTGERFVCYLHFMRELHHLDLYYKVVVMCGGSVQCQTERTISDFFHYHQYEYVVKRYQTFVFIMITKMLEYFSNLLRPYFVLHNAYVEFDDLVYGVIELYKHFKFPTRFASSIK